LISPEYPPAERMGGIGTNTATVARALARLGEDVLVVTRGSSGRYEDDGVEVVRLERRWLPHAAAERLLAYRKIAKAARRFRPDVVYAAEWEAEAWWVARWTSIPVVTRLATPTYLLELLNFGELQPRTAFVRRLERDQARRSALVVAPTRAIADRVSGDWGLGDGSVEIVPNPVDLDEVARAGLTESPIELPARFVAFIGRLERRKGLEPLGLALGPLLAARPDLHAVLVGRDSGAEGGAVMDAFRADTADVADRVHVLGELPREAALSVVARSEVVVLPSLWESFGHVCVEAMALGRPVVAADVGGFAEIVQDGSSGWLVPPGDAHALEQALARSVDAGAEERRRVGEAARRRARDFGVDAVCDRVAGLLERAAGDPRSRQAGAAGYRRYFRPEDRTDPFRELYKEKREAVLAHFAAGPRRRILDVGGGYGRLAGPLSRDHDVVLCDVSEEMLEEARERWPGLEVVHGDARRLPFADGEFDAALAIDLSPHLPDLEDGLRELVRVVGAGGEVVFDTTSSSPWWVLAYPAYVNWRPKRLLLTMLAGGVLPEWRATVRHHRPDEVREAATAAGLRLEGYRKLGPRWSAKWHLWWGTAAP
jgi:glycogen(starch) synthase